MGLSENQLYLDIQEKLRVPFDVTEVEFRPAEQNGDVLAYVNDKAYIDRLHQDAPGQWLMSDLQTTGEGKQTVVSLCITIAGVTMYGISDPKQPTSAFAQALKRACTYHGLGADLYRFPKIWGNMVKYNESGRAIQTNHLSIAVWAYDTLGLEVPDEVRESLREVESWKLFNPTNRAEHQQSQPSRESQRPQEQDAGLASGSGEGHDPGRHHGKLSEKQCGVMYRAGITDDEIARLETQDARYVVSALIKKEMDAEQFRSTYLGVRPAASSGGVRKSSW